MHSVGVEDEGGVRDVMLSCRLKVYTSLNVDILLIEADL